MGLYSDHLADLLDDALLNPSGDALEEERRVVDATIKRLDRSNIIGFVGYAYGRPDPGDEFAAMIDAAGEQHMSAWVGGDLLRRRFAGASLVNLLETYIGPVVVAAALAVETERLMRRRAIVPQLAGLAEASLARLADVERQVSFEDSPPIQDPTTTKAGDLPPENDTPVSNRLLRPYIQKARRASRESSEATESRVERLEKLAMRSSEEIDLLWWTLRPTSSYAPTWDEAGAAATMLASLEVARRTIMDPPPRGTDLVLADALRKAAVDPFESVNPADVLQSLPAEALHDSLLDGSGSSSSQPMLSWLRQRRDASDEQAGLPTEPCATRLRWALQLIYELSLQRVLA